MTNISLLIVAITAQWGDGFGSRVTVPMLRRIVMDPLGNRSARYRALLPYLFHELARRNTASVSELFVDVFTGGSGWDNVGRGAFFHAMARVPEGVPLSGLLTTLFEMAVFASPHVRCGVAVALHTVVAATGCDEDTNTRGILRIVLALAGDAEPSVRAEAVATIGTVLTHISAREWVDKLGEALSTMVRTDGP